MKRIFFILLLLSPILLISQDQAPKVYPFSFNGDWGIIDENQNVILEPKLERIRFFNQNEGDRIAAIATQNGMKGLIDGRGKWILKPKYDSISPPAYYAKNLRWASKGGLFGLVSTERKRAQFLIKPQFTTVSRFDGRKLSVAVVGTEAGSGAVNALGEIIAEPIYDEVRIVYDYEDYPNLLLTKNEEITYIDCWGNPQANELMEDYGDFYDTAIDAEEGIFSGERKPQLEYQRNNATGRWEVTTKTYNRNTNTFDSEILTLDEGYTIMNVNYYSDTWDNTIDIRYILVAQNDRFGILNKLGEIITPVIYEEIDIDKFRGRETITLIQNGLKGLANEQGKQILLPLFSAVRPFNESYSLIEITRPDGYFGYADWDGNIFLPAQK